MRAMMPTAGLAALRRSVRLLTLPLAFGLAGCDDQGVESRFPEFGDPEQGQALIELAGCGTCHQIPGIDEAGGLVGPPLHGIGDRIFIAGVLRNTPQNMMLWLKDPQAVVPGNAMPDMGLTDDQARNIAAYLYTLGAR